jgi:hypothetical protein
MEGNEGDTKEQWDKPINHKREASWEDVGVKGF